MENRKENMKIFTQKRYFQKYNAKEANLVKRKLKEKKLLHFYELHEASVCGLEISQVYSYRKKGKSTVFWESEMKQALPKQ